MNYLVNSAVSFIGKGLDVTRADWERSLGVNVLGAAQMAQACHAAMKAAGGGAIVNIASISVMSRSRTAGPTMPFLPLRMGNECEAQVFANATAKMVP